MSQMAGGCQLIAGANRKEACLTWCDLLQEGLDVSGELDDVVRRPGPEDKAVPGVLEAWLDFGALQPQQEGIDDELFEVGGEELFLLLAVSLGPVGGVECLDLGLWQVSGPFIRVGCGR
jgi:hypothetical protein